MSIFVGMRFFLVYGIFLTLFFSCKTDSDQKGASGSVYEARYTSFSISYYKNYKVIKVFPSYLKGDTIGYVLYKENTATPEEWKRYQKIKTPVKKIIPLSNTHISILDTLQLLERVAGIADQKYVSNSFLQKQFKAGKISDVGENGALNTEQIIALGPDLLMCNETTQSHKKYEVLQHAGIAVVSNGDWLETSPLAKSEWMIFVAAFFDKEAEAIALFKGIEKEYLHIRNRLDEVGDKPKVMVNIPYKGTWFLPGGKSYYAVLMDDAGMDYVYKDNGEINSISKDLEEMYKMGLEADLWINIGNLNSMEELLALNPLYADFKAVKEDQVYNNNLQTNEQGVNLYWDTNILYPHYVLADLIKIAHPDKMRDHQWFYYQVLKKKN